MRALQLIKDRRIEMRKIPNAAAASVGEVKVSMKAFAIDVWEWRGMAFANRRLTLVTRAGASDIANLVLGQPVLIKGARTCGLCRACRDGRDNLCTQVEGVYGSHLDSFALDRVNRPARLLVPVPPSVDMARPR